MEMENNFLQTEIAIRENITKENLMEVVNMNGLMVVVTKDSSNTVIDKAREFFTNPMDAFTKVKYLLS